MPAPEAIFLSVLSVGHVEVIVAAYRMGFRIPFIVPFMSIDAVKAINAEEPGAAENAITFHAWLATQRYPRARNS